MDETMIPKGKWYCPGCMKKEKYSTKGKGKSKTKNLKQQFKTTIDHQFSVNH